jgi:hypothetical protein
MMTEEEYVLKVCCRNRGRLCCDAGEHLRGIYQNDNSAINALLKEARVLKEIYDTVQITITQGNRIVYRQYV